MMNKYWAAFFSQLLIIGMTTNVRTDIPFWKQIIAYILIAMIIPLCVLVGDCTNKSAKKAVKRNDLN